MKNNAVLTQQNGTLILNGETVSREEVSVLFDLLAFEVDTTQSNEAFYENAVISLKTVPQNELDRVYDDFLIWKRISDLQESSRLRRESAYVETI